MYIKFLKHGKGDPAKAASYLIDDVDHLNRPRPDVQVLRGDPQTFTALAESIQNEWKYTSGVIAWSKDDAPTNDEIDQVLEAFEKHAFAGLKPNQYHFTAVLHEEDDGSKHVHFLVPRVELDTGKALNIAPPGHEKYFDPLRDYFNYSKGWSRPDDPALKRDTQTPDHIHFQDKSAVRAGLTGKTRKDIREVIGSYIEQRVEHGFIRNRKDVLEAISELGQAKPSEKYISFKLDGADKAIRLKGAFYESDFNIKSYFEDRARKANDARASGEYRVVSPEHRELAEQCRTKSEKFANKRATYNGERYQSDGRSQVEPNFSPNREPEFSPVFTTANERNSQSFEPTGTAAQAAKSTVRSLEQHEPGDSRNSKDQENPYFIEYSLDFNSLYHAYQQHIARLYQQKQIQRTTSEISTFAADRSNDTAENSRVQHGDNSTVQGTRGEINNDTGSAIIADYRRTATSAQTATRATAASISAYTAAGADYQRARELHSDFKRETQRSSASRETLSNDSEAAIRADNTTAFFRQFAERLTATAGETFNSVSRLLEHRAADHQSLTTPDADRNREAARTTDQTSDRENEFSRAISTKSSSFSATPIREALERVEQRQQIEVEKKQDYDSPRPF